ncbi:hypothetical protein LCGC14_0845250 [marine sediment metagenome]|uniref:Uncharacterized protein n=2 Tax=marine sediment metagenome TaxID=412755 RepID=A0A0F9PBX5_9ZZZZ
MNYFMVWLPVPTRPWRIQDAADNLLRDESDAAWRFHTYEDALSFIEQLPID